MKHRNRSLIAVAVVAVLALSACKSSTVEEPTEPAEVIAVKGSDLSRVKLTEEGVSLLGIRTEPVRRSAHHSPAGTEIPYAALIYAPNGQTYVFTEVNSRTFVRHSIEVHSINGHTAILSAGPPAGTRVVTVGASELYGAETGVEE